MFCARPKVNTAAAHEHAEALLIMKVAVIGTGNVGKALGSSLTRAGHEVTLAARDAEKTKAVAAEVGARAASTPAEAASTADVVILAVPYAQIDAVARELRDEASGKLVIDVTNPLTPDYSGLATAGGPSAAEQLAGKLEGARVAKAFNTLFASIQANPSALGSKVDALYATNEDEVRPQLVEQIRSIGLRPVDAGPLERARQLEALAWLNMGIQMQFGGAWRSAFVLVDAPEAAVGA
jgi:NADPH-dependent F420 reductase